MTAIHPIRSSPYAEPHEHILYDEAQGVHRVEPGRRPAQYILVRSIQGEEHPAIHPIDLANTIRAQVAAWRAKGHPGTTPVTKALLDHWTRPGRERQLFFCQLEAVETLIWLCEVGQHGLQIESGGAAFQRYCCKMATGTGKTTAMAMAIAWQVLNKAANRQNANYSKNILVVTPGITVKERLQVLLPASEDNYYDEFDLVPPSMREQVNDARIEIRNWHKLARPKEKKRGVRKLGEMSDESFAKRALGTKAQNWLVINDEAHHAYDGTEWMEGLGRIHRASGAARCFDFTATPFPAKKSERQEPLFKWVVSDFGLNDAIESGLVKTPKAVIWTDAATDSKTGKPKLTHLYREPSVKDNLNRHGAKAADALPDAVVEAYRLLITNWEKTARNWRLESPPVLFTTANRTMTAARIKNAFDKRAFGPRIGEVLCKPEHILHIDSEALKKAEAGGEQSGSEKQRQEHLRMQVKTVGVPGEPGAEIRNVISVDMVSEGWDAKNVTHIMGLRAFMSQLLCEQIVGRGLRRTSYTDVNEKTGMMHAEYVDVIGVPLEFMTQVVPEKTGDQTGQQDESATVQINPLAEREHLAIEWPNVIRADHEVLPEISVNVQKMDPLIINANEVPTIKAMATVKGGKKDPAQISITDLQKDLPYQRMQEMAFHQAIQLYDEMEEDWRKQGMKHGKGLLVAQLIEVVTEALEDDHWLRFEPPLFNQEPERRRVLTIQCMNRIQRHLTREIRFQSRGRMRVEVGNPETMSTGGMRPWLTRKPVAETVKSHINRCVCDSGLEQAAAHILDNSAKVEAWVKNERLGFCIGYIDEGLDRRYYPDFLVRMKSGAHLIVEMKGMERRKEPAKHDAARRWAAAVSEAKRWGEWGFTVARSQEELRAILK